MDTSTCEVCGKTYDQFCIETSTICPRKRFIPITNTMTPEQKLEAIQALLDGEWDNEQLEKIGNLFQTTNNNIKTILNYPSA